MNDKNSQKDIFTLHTLGSNPSVQQPQGLTRPSLIAEIDKVTELFPFICGICSMRFNKLIEFYRHFHHHNISNVQKYFHVCQDRTDPVTPSNDPRMRNKCGFYSCGLCHIPFPTLCALHEHLDCEEKATHYTVDIRTNQVQNIVRNGSSVPVSQREYRNDTETNEQTFSAQRNQHNVNINFDKRHGPPSHCVKNINGVSVNNISSASFEKGVTAACSSCSYALFERCQGYVEVKPFSIDATSDCGKSTIHSFSSLAEQKKNTACTAVTKYVTLSEQENRLNETRLDNSNVDRNVSSLSNDKLQNTTEKSFPKHYDLNHVSFNCDQSMTEKPDELELERKGPRKENKEPENKDQTIQYNTRCANKLIKRLNSCTGTGTEENITFLKVIQGPYENDIETDIVKDQARYVGSDGVDKTCNSAEHHSIKEQKTCGEKSYSKSVKNDTFRSVGNDLDNIECSSEDVDKSEDNIGDADSDDIVRKSKMFSDPKRERRRLMMIRYQRNYRERKKIKALGHLKSKSKDRTSNIDNSRTTDVTVADKVVSSSEIKVPCDVCGLLFKKKNLKRHTETHTDIKPYQCDICLKKFKTKNYLYGHKAHHRTVKDLICDYCGKAFNNGPNLRQHLKIHVRKKTLQCPLCPKTFRSNFVLKDHVQRHSNDRPHVCPVCGRTFKVAQEVTRHMSTHSDNRPHICTVCSKGFKSRSHLIKHEKIHTR